MTVDTNKGTAMTTRTSAWFSARDVALITIFSTLVTLLVAVTAPAITVATAGIIPIPVWASLIWPMGGVFIRALVNRPLTNAFSGFIEGAVGSFVLPIGIFGLVALPAQGLLFDLVFGWRRAKPTQLLPAALAGALAGIFFVFLIVYVFFDLRRPIPFQASLLGGVAGAISGVLGCLLARRVRRLGLLTDDVVEGGAT
jgi:hypothetical protein